jgi:hypothetical protein
MTPPPRAVAERFGGTYYHFAPPRKQILFAR